MFEKEAKEYMHKDGTESEKLLNTIDLSLTKRQAFVLINICKQCFKDGAEFGNNKAKEEMQEQGLALQSDMDKTIEQNIQLKKQIEKMKKYIKACWVEENLNDYSSYITNTSDEFRDLVKELNNEVRNGR